MAGNFKRGRGKPEKLLGRGVLQACTTEGPFTEWLGMPPYYIHHLTIDDESYSYLSGDAKLEIELGKKVAFRYRQTTKGKAIDKRSLGVVIDPSELS